AAPVGTISIDIGGSPAGKATHPPCKPATPRAAYPIHIQRAPPESAAGPSGSISSRWPATARITLPTIDRTYLRRRKALLIWRGTESSNPSPSSEESAANLIFEEESHLR